MSLKGLHRHRHLAAGFALAGMAFYAVLLPWHTVSQATNAGVGSRIGITDELPCHGASAVTNGEPSSKGPTPANKTHCPICNGFAALQLATAAASIPLLLPSPFDGSLLQRTEDQLAEALVRAPQSRGPPSQSA